jgi:DNA-binding transcriptional ArsR family regulator
VNGLLSVARLLEEPRLARLYTYVLQNDEVTIDEIASALELPRTTVYSDTGTLVEFGVLTRDDDQKTHTYSAVPITLTATLDADQYTGTPTLIDAFGRSPHDQDLDLLIERYGLGKLAAALTYAIPYTNGNMSERVAARELDLQYAFAIAVLHALRDVVRDMESEDPYFEDIQDAREHPPATEE